MRQGVTGRPRGKDVSGGEMILFIGRLLCRVFGHWWHYQSVTLSDQAGEPPARVCCRCEFSYVERFINGQWVPRRRWDDRVMSKDYAGYCIRKAGHHAPCNGYPRVDCKFFISRRRFNEGATD